MTLVSTRTQNYTFGRGELQFASFAPGTQNPQGFRYIGNSPAVGYTATIQEIDHRNSDHGVSELDFSVPTSVDRSGTFTTDDVNLDNIAMNWFGTHATVTNTGAVELTETLPAAVAGLTYQLGMTPSNIVGIRNIANIAVKNGATVLTIGTDYTVDLARGLVRATEGGAMVGVAAAVTYDRLAGSYDQVLSGNTPVEGSMMYIADNPYGANIDYLIPWCRLVPNGEFSLKAENALQQLGFTMKILRRPGLSAVYANGQPHS